MTTLKLQWVAERVRKARQIKKLVDSGQYHVDSHEVAKAVIGLKAFYKEEPE
jgi:anti-sigma28 factor (negative regulator of flagellin synthesis)